MISKWNWNHCFAHVILLMSFIHSIVKPLSQSLHKKRLIWHKYQDIGCFSAVISDHRTKIKIYLEIPFFKVLFKKNISYFIVWSFLNYIVGIMYNLGLHVELSIFSSSGPSLIMLVLVVKGWLPKHELRSIFTFFYFYIFLYIDT